MGHDSIHTLDLPNQNLTADAEINRISIDEQRIVVSKDADFVDSLLLRDKPYKLLVVATGNIRNATLVNLLGENLDQIVAMFAQSRYVEITADSLVDHG